MKIRPKEMKKIVMIDRRTPVQKDRPRRPQRSADAGIKLSCSVALYGQREFVGDKPRRYGVCPW